MDDLKRQKRKLGYGLEKQAQDNPTVNINDVEPGKDDLTIDDKICQMPADLKDLPEINYSDPEVKKWMAEEEAERTKNMVGPPQKKLRLFINAAKNSKEKIQPLTFKLHLSGPTMRFIFSLQ